MSKYTKCNFTFILGKDIIYTKGYKTNVSISATTVTIYICKYKGKWITVEPKTGLWIYKPPYRNSRTDTMFNTQKLLSDTTLEKYNVAVARGIDTYKNREFNNIVDYTDREMLDIFKYMYSDMDNYSSSNLGFCYYYKRALINIYSNPKRLVENIDIVDCTPSLKYIGKGYSLKVDAILWSELLMATSFIDKTVLLAIINILTKQLKELNHE